MRSKGHQPGEELLPDGGTYVFFFASGDNKDSSRVAESLIDCI